MNKQTRLIAILSDGSFHSGEELGKTMGISRTGIWKTINKLSEYNLDVHSVRGKGYRLSHPVELLDTDTLMQTLNARTGKLISQLEVFLKCDSTNAYLMQKQKTTSNPDTSKAQVCLAEMQTSGRGRRGRKWVSPFGGNIYLSIAKHFAVDPHMLSGLGLALSVAIIRTLNEAGAKDLQLKWPNDILWQNKKLAGILIEMVAESTGPCRVVIGVGLNINLSGPATDEIDQPWVDLNTVMHTLPSRNKLAASLLEQIFIVMGEYERSGLAAFIGEWRRYDAYAGKQVKLLLHENIINGLCEGIDNMGALLVRTGNGRVQKFSSGEISLRI